MPVAKPDYYEILGVGRDVDESSLKSAYRKLAMQYHPDRNPGNGAAEEKFKLAAEAYGVLSDPQKRSTYDRFGHAGLQGNGAQANPADFGDFQDVFGDFFESFFGGAAAGAGAGAGRSRVRRGDDLRYDLEITFEEAMRGKQVDLAIPKMVTCVECDGSGAEKVDGLTTCPTCRGRGEQVINQGFISVRQTCGTCGGRGQLIRRPCKVCKGQGSTRETRNLKVNVPAGVDTGTQMRVTGEGNPSRSGGPAGDLYVVLRVADHKFFERHEHDLHCTIPISIPQAALGTTVEIETFDGIEIVKVPEGSQPRTRLRLRGKGVPRVNSSGRGDLYVHIDVRIPEKLNKEQRKLFEQLDTMLPKDNEPRDKGFFEKVREYFN